MGGSFLAALFAIVWIDLLLSGDNAVVIALVCRGLPTNQQRIGMVVGTGAAVLLRIVMALLASILLSIEGLRILGGLFVLYVSFGLLRDEADGEDGAREPISLLGAIAAIGIADASMSLDNVMAIAALAKGSVWLMVIGIVISIPLVIAGAAVIQSLVNRFPLVVWFGSGLLAWVGGEIILDDPFVKSLHLPTLAVTISPISVVCCVGIIIAGLIYRNWKTQDSLTN